MNKPKVEFYNINISLLLLPTDLKVYCSNLLVDVYVSTKFERHSIKNNREISERSFVLFCLLVNLTVDLHAWKCIQLMYKLLSIYKPSLKEMWKKNDREIGWRRWWERRKIKSKKEKTLQQQEGLPTMSVDLNYDMKYFAKYLIKEIKFTLKFIYNDNILQRQFRTEIYARPPDFHFKLIL